MLTNRRTLARTFRSSLLGSLALVATGLVVIPVARAQAQAQPPARVLVPTTTQTMMRCEAGAAWYAVATFGPQTILGSTGAISDGYIQVLYPKGTPVVVKAEEVDVDEAQGLATLIRRSRLRAYSVNNPVMEECFKAVLDQFLEPGIQLQVRGPIRNLSGQPAGWIVDAPQGATGWVLHSDLREATPEELERFASAGSTAPVLDLASSPAPSATRAQPDAQQPPTIEMTDATSENAETPVDQVAAFPSPQPPAGDFESEPEAAPEPMTTEERLSPTLKALEAAFDRMRRQPIEASDETELLEQYRVLETQLVEDGATENSMEFISQRIAVLELRSQLRETSYEIERMEQRIAGAGEIYTQSVERLSQGREYLAVGRLMASSLYDGTRMPLLYRLVSIDSAIPRTLAYITPEPSLALDSKTGAVVGVLGAGTLETSAEIGIIRPTAVDVLRPATGPSSGTASASADQ